MPEGSARAPAPAAQISSAMSASAFAPDDRGAHSKMVRPWLWASSIFTDHPSTVRDSTAGNRARSFSRISSASRDASPVSKATLKFIPTPIGTSGGTPYFSTAAEKQTVRDDKFAQRIDLMTKKLSFVVPAEMIMVGDARAFENPSLYSTWPANLDPTQYDQWPSNRHNYQTDILFCDAHAMGARRHDVIDPQNTVWRSRWNNDHDPHLSISWTINPAQEVALDP